MTKVRAAVVTLSETNSMTDQSRELKPIHTAAARIAIALIQAATLYGLLSAADAPASWPATSPMLFMPLILLAIFAPIAAQMAMQEIRARLFVRWLIGVVLALAAIGLHAGTRGQLASYPGEDVTWPPAWIIVSSALALFVAQSLAIASLRERTWSPSYRTLFEAAWKQGVQLTLSFLFVGAFWSLLYLAAGLFDMVGLPGLSTVLKQRWFALPATTLAVAAAVHATDVRPQVLRGARSLLLVLLSWLTPLFAALLAAFLLSLPFASLDRLWATRMGTGTLIAAGAWLVLLLNATWQDGSEEAGGPPFKQVFVRLGGFVLAPLVCLACWGLWLRVAEHGWSVRRVESAAILLVGLCYAAGYLIAALRNERRSETLARTNFVTAYVGLATVLALCSPLADPARLMVASQIARLETGEIKADQFDFGAIRFEGARWGQAALVRLRDIGDKQVASRAQETLARLSRYGTVAKKPASTPEERAARFETRPEGRELPPGFLDGVAADPYVSTVCFDTNRPTKCLARFVVLPFHQTESILVAGPANPWLFEQDGDGDWRFVANLNGYQCQAAQKVLKDAEPSFEMAERPDILIGGRRFVLVPPQKPCASQP